MHQEFKYFIADIKIEEYVARAANDVYMVKSNCNSITFLPDQSATGSAAIIENIWPLPVQGPPTVFEHNKGVVDTHLYRIKITDAGGKVIVTRIFHRECSKAEFDKLMSNGQ